MNKPDEIKTKLNAWLDAKRTLWLLVTIGVIFLLVFDNDSVLYQRKLNREIRNLRAENQRLAREIRENQNLLQHFDHYDYLEKYARKTFYLRKKNEDIYLINRPDSLKR